MSSPMRTSGGNNLVPASNQQNVAAVSPYNRATSMSSEQSSHGTFLDGLRALPVAREVPWRRGHELPSERSFESPRVQQRGASLLSTRGQIANPPCAHCASGLGRFSICVSLPQWFQGACATCVFTSMGNKCSLRVDALRNGNKRGLEGGNAAARRRKRRARSPLLDNLRYVNKYGSASGSEDMARTYTPMDSTVENSADLDGLWEEDTSLGESTGLLQYVQLASSHQKSRTGKDPVLRVNSLPRPNAPTPTSYDSMFSNNTANQSGPSPQAAVRPDWAQNILRDQQRSAIPSFSSTSRPGLSGVVQEIQSGINHLQRQLDLLQSMLNLENEESTNDIVAEGIS